MYHGADKSTCLFTHAHVTAGGETGVMFHYPATETLPYDSFNDIRSVSDMFTNSPGLKLWRLPFLVRMPTKQFLISTRDGILSEDDN